MTLEHLNAIKQMVDNIAAKNLVAVDPLFNTEISTKISERLDARRQELAAALYSKKSEPEQETQVDAE